MEALTIKCTAEDVTLKSENVIMSISVLQKRCMSTVYKLLEAVANSRLKATGILMIEASDNLRFNSAADSKIYAVFGLKMCE